MEEINITQLDVGQNDRFLVTQTMKFRNLFIEKWKQFVIVI